MKRFGGRFHMAASQGGVATPQKQIAGPLPTITIAFNKALGTLKISFIKKSGFAL